MLKPFALNKKKIFFFCCNFFSGTRRKHHSISTCCSKRENLCEPSTAIQHLFLVHTSKHLRFPLTPSLSLLPTPILDDFASPGNSEPYSNSMGLLPWIIPILHSGWWVPMHCGCAHRWELGPVIASICCITPQFLLVLFQFSSIQLCFSLQCYLLLKDT